MNDKLREALEALERISANETLGQHYSNGCLCDDVAVIREALAASKQEPQAQAEPVVWTFGPNLFKDWCGRWFGPDSDDAYLAKAANDLPFMANPLREAIAKKDAALESCVEALEKMIRHFSIKRLGESRLKDSEVRGKGHAAITQAKDARK